MWINEDIFYLENFLSEYELEALHKIIEENQHIVEEILSSPERGGYHTFPTTDPIIESVNNRMFRVLRENKFDFGDFFPRQEIQFIGPGSGQSVHVDGNGSGTDVSWGLVCYLSDPDTYTGGEIFYPDHGEEIKPALGSLAIHRGRIKHGVRDVGVSPRYVLIAFTSAPMV